MITPGGIWTQGHQNPLYKPAMDACMAVYPGVMIYTGETSREKWLELGTPVQWVTNEYGGLKLLTHEDLIPFTLAYHALCEQFEEPRPPEWYEMVAKRKVERDRRKEVEIIRREEEEQQYLQQLSDQSHGSCE